MTKKELEEELGQVEDTCKRQWNELVELRKIKDFVQIRGAEVVQVIQVTYVKGLGTSDSPVREVIEWRALDGKFIGQHPTKDDEQFLLGQ